MAYNGWKNYETWNVALWIGDGAFYGSNYWLDRAGEVSDAHQLAGEMRDVVLDEAEALVSGGPFADLLPAALGRVDWDEIARHYMEDAEG